MTETRSRILILGASGAVGSAVTASFSNEGWEVVGVSRNSPKIEGGVSLALDPLALSVDLTPLKQHGPYAAICWAQGCNLNDSVFDVDLDQHLEAYKANCLYIISTLKYLLQTDSIESGARLCVVSSIWQNLARQDKLSYCMSKAALQGLVLSASVDLGKKGILINAVLPGALDTPMTRQNLAPDQIDKLSNTTYFARMPSLQDVTSTIHFLCSKANTGTTGQFIAVDLGFSHARIL